MFCLTWDPKEGVIVDPNFKHNSLVYDKIKSQMLPTTESKYGRNADLLPQLRSIANNQQYYW